jgi:hypothetical protein
VAAGAAAVVGAGAAGAVVAAGAAGAVVAAGFGASVGFAAGAVVAAGGAAAGPHAASSNVAADSKETKRLMCNDPSRVAGSSGLGYRLDAQIALRRASPCLYEPLLR